MKIVTADIGGTHARFALAELRESECPLMGAMRRYRTREHPGLASAWAAFAADAGEPLPRAAALAVAAPIEGDLLSFVNSGWIIDRRNIAAELGLDTLTLLNDFGAVAFAVSAMAPGELVHIAGPDSPLPAEGVTSVIGPGTGLGVSLLVRRAGRVSVIETEAAHIAFAPLDAEEEALAHAIRARHGRASVERVVSGPGLLEIYGHLGGGAWDPNDAGTLWSAAIDETDPLARRALDVLLRCFGAAAGDIALAHGAMGLALTGGLANRLAPLLPASAFAARFIDKGRYRPRMERIPVKLVTYDEPGLLGAAIAFQREWDA